MASGTTRLTRKKISALFDAYLRFEYEVSNNVDRIALRLGVSGSRKRNLLYKAIQTGNVKMTCKVLQTGIDVSRDFVALEKAAAKGNMEIMQLLLEYGCDPSLAENNALNIAAVRGHTNIAMLLIEAGMVYDKRNQFNETLVYVAACGDNTALIDNLVQLGCDINAPSRSWTPLHVAAMRNHTQSLVCLLKHGADPNIRTVQGYTPLDVAISEGRMMIVKYLVSAGAEYNLEQLMNVPIIANQLQRNQSLLNFLQENEQLVRPLLELTRIAVRNLVGQNLSHKLRQVPLPKFLQNYVVSVVSVEEEEEEE